MQQGAITTDARALADRRCFGWRTVLYGFLRSRRRQSRRGDEPEPLFTDWHHPWLFFLSVFIMLFSTVDAFMTLQLLDRGADEANRAMASAMAQGTHFFAQVKMLLTALGVLALVFLSRARFMNCVPTGSFLTAVFAMYACLVCYEFVFLLQVS
ncbi:MAG: DUF5658 family protein [Woeseiaceae bacterium]|nr:DUF5658 family protein [Woeseiaceae bacterium]